MHHLDLPLFKVTTAKDAAGNVWFCFKIESGLYQDYLFMIAAKSPDEMQYIYAKLDERDGEELKNLEPTEESSRLAILLMDYVVESQVKMLDDLKHPMYNKRIKKVTKGK